MACTFNINSPNFKFDCGNSWPMFQSFAPLKFVMPSRRMIWLRQQYSELLLYLIWFKHILFQFFNEKGLGISFYNIICALSSCYIWNRMSDKWHQIFLKSFWVMIEQNFKCRRSYLSGDRHKSYLGEPTKVVFIHVCRLFGYRLYYSSVPLRPKRCLVKKHFDSSTDRFMAEYCEILFIRGDPIFVVFVVGLAHEFMIPRIMNTTYVPQIDICTFLNKIQYLYAFIHIFAKW